MKITIATIFVTLAIIGWRLHDMGPGLSSSVGHSGIADEGETFSSGPGWMPFESAIVEADSTGRPSMVFIYSDWCPWCRKTFQETFTDEAVLEYLQTNYQVVKLNSDGSAPAIIMNDQTITEAQLVQILGATGLPTYVFLDSKGEPITKTMGFYDSEGLLEVLKSVAER